MTPNQIFGLLSDLGFLACAPGRIRTRDRLLRRQLLCPAELQAPELIVPDRGHALDLVRAKPGAGHGPPGGAGLALPIVVSHDPTRQASGSCGARRARPPGGCEPPVATSGWHRGRRRR
jgi:hypothetical protein